MKNITQQSRILRTFTGGTPWRSVAKPSFTAITQAKKEFVIENDEATTSKGFHRFGMPFKKGDIPKYCSVEIYRNNSLVPAQFDQRVTWDDGSLKFAVCSMRDTDFTASESRTYEFRQSYVPFNNTGTKTLSDVTAATDFKVELTNNQRYNGTANEADPVGASLSASFNTACLIDANVIKTIDPKLGGCYTSGPISQSWKVRAPFINGSSTEHPHLEAWFYLTAWKDSEDNIVDFECAPMLRQDKWKAADKYRQDYDASFKNGVTTLSAVTSAQHPYHSWGMLLDLTDKNTRYACRSFINNAPTLQYKPNQGYWIESGLVPKHEVSHEAAVLAYSDGFANVTLDMFGNMIHGSAIDAGGESELRGIISNPDVLAFLGKTSRLYRRCRTASLAGLHRANHFTDDVTRTIKTSPSFDGDIIPTKGLPDPVKAACDWGSSSIRTDIGEQDEFSAPLGGKGVWTETGNTSHEGSYVYFSYLITGEHYLLDNLTSLMPSCLHRRVNARTYPMYYLSNTYRQTQLGITDETNSQVFVGEQQSRGLGWGFNIIGQVLNTTPDNLIETKYLKHVAEQNIAWAYAGYNNLPQSQKDAGILWDYSEGVSNTWMLSFITDGLASTYIATQDARVFTMLDMTARYHEKLMEWGPLYAESYRTPTLPIINGASFGTSGWEAGTNEYLSKGYYFLSYNSISGSLINYADQSGSTNEIAWVQDGFGVTPQNGDIVYPWTMTTGAVIRGLPPELSEGTEYYIRDIDTINKTYRLAATPNGAALTISDIGEIWMTYRLAAAEIQGQNSAAGYDGLYSQQSMTALMYAKQAGCTVSAQAQSNLDAYFSTVPVDSSFKWWVSK